MHSKPNDKCHRIERHQDVAWTGLLLTSLAIAGCSPAQSEPRIEYQGSTDTAAVLATVDGQPLTVSDLSEEVQARLKALEFQYLNQRHQLLDGAVRGLLAQRLLEEEAERQGISLNQLIGAMTDGDISVTQEDVATWYRRNRSRLRQSSGSGATSRF